MKISEIIGIDLSKITFDVHIYSCKMHFKFTNKNSGFKRLIKSVDKNSPNPPEQRMYILEYTGMYSHQIEEYFNANKIPYVMIPGLAVKKSLGITRGKDDKIDAAKLALYGHRLRDELQPTKKTDPVIQSLKRLTTLRERMVKQRAGFIASLKESKRVYLRKDNEIYFSSQEKIIRSLSKQIKEIENQISILINEQHNLKRQYDLILSIKGVGLQTAVNLIFYTEGFTKFENSRKFASYCGIAPFPNSSGTSIRGRSKISHLANKKVKSLLDLCAKSAIQFNNEMKIYYKNRIDQGKDKRSTINIIRNKLLARIFAVVKRDIPYVDVLRYAA